MNRFLERRLFMFSTLIKEQISLQNKLKTDSIKEKDIHLIAGMDVQHGETHGICAYQIFNYETGDIVEESVFILNEVFPYETGFLYYREKPFMEEALKRMKYDVQLIACDGNGVLHPRYMGEASHFGIINNIPTIGIAKHIMKFDELKEKNNKYYIDNICVGEKVFLNKNSKTPMYVSPGYKISLNLAVKVVYHMQHFSNNSKYSFLTKGSDHLARMKQKEIYKK